MQKILYNRKEGLFCRPHTPLPPGKPAFLERKIRMHLRKKKLFSSLLAAALLAFSVPAVGAAPQVFAAQTQQSQASWLNVQSLQLTQEVGIGSFTIEGASSSGGIFIEPEDPSIASVSFAGVDASGATYRVTGLQAGSTSLSVSYGGQQASIAVTVYPKGGSITLDTVNYRMAPGNIYDIGVTVTDGDGQALSGSQVQQMVRNGTLRVSDSRTGSIVNLTQLANGNFRVTGRNPGTCYIIYEIVQDGGAVTHSSVRIDVQNGVAQGGVATRDTSWWADKGQSLIPSAGASTEITPAISSITVSSGDDLMEQFIEVMNSRSSEVDIHVPRGQEAAYQTLLLEQIERFQDVLQLRTSYVNGSGQFTVNITYNDAARIMAYLEGKSSSLSAEDQQTLAAAREVYADLVDPSMSEYEIVLAFHDYLVNTVTYRETGDRSHAAVGALVDGRAVCDGYVKALDLLCYLADIECLRISGIGYSGGQQEAHAWNKVEIDGQWYNVDVTWDDPVSSTPVLRHTYFLISDDLLGQDHQWYLYSHWPQAPENYPDNL